VPSQLHLEKVSALQAEKASLLHELSVVRESLKTDKGLSASDQGNAVEVSLESAVFYIYLHV
jgi:hypothetical protein